MSRPFGPAALLASSSFILTALAPPLSPEIPSASAETAAKVTISLENYALENGLEVILHEDHKTPIVAVNLWYHVGSKDEPAGKNGFAHLFEHVMFQGSRNVGEDMFFRYLERAGASERNGTTDSDRTNYFETLPANELALALWLESDRMGFLLDHADQKTFERQREVVKNERRQNYENAPYGLVLQFIRAAIYPADHPYHRLTIGTPEDLDAASFDDVKAFFRTFYLPNNATLVIAGDFDRAQAKQLVAKYFGPLPRGPSPRVKTAPMPPPLSQEKRLQVEAGVELPRLIVSWPTPPHFAPGDGELDLLAHVLATGKSSRLHKRLVYDLQIAQDVGAFQQSAQLSSVFEIMVTLKKNQSLPEALKVVDEELAQIRAKPPTEDEVGRARTKFVADVIFQMETVGSKANLLNLYNQLAGDPNYFEKDLSRYRAAKATDLQNAAARYLPEGRRVVTFVTPTPGAPRAGRLIGGN